MINERREKLADLLAQCVDEEGIPLNIDIFESRSHKRVDDLLTEENGTEIDISRDPGKGRFIISRISCRVIVEDNESKMRFCETGREFSDGHVVMHEEPQDYGLKGTRRKSEDAIETLIWEIYEETNILVDRDELFETPEQKNNNLKGLQPDRASDVYYGAVSRVWIFQFTWRPFARNWRSLLGGLLKPHFLETRSSKPMKRSDVVRVRLSSLWYRYKFWQRYKKNEITVIKEPDGMKVFAQWFPKPEHEIHFEVPSEEEKAELRKLPVLFEKLLSSSDED